MAFKEKAIVKGNLLLFSKENAKSFIEACREDNIGILGIDGFYLKGDAIQPSSKDSVDFSSTHHRPKNDNRFEEAIEYVEERGDDQVFEITCSS